MRLLKVVLAVSLLCAVPLARALGQEEAVKSVQDGVFTTAQAERGEKVFGNICAECHQIEEFATSGYMDSWTGARVSEFFDLIQATMPEDNPGSLRAREYADVLAFFFTMNGLPPGEDEMESEFTALQQILIEGPYPKGSND